jgi:tRNA pseudouridine38-40 synthase
MKIALKVAYDGTDYRGLARQPGQTTVQGQLEERLAHLLRQPIVTTAAGRTDAGVHAEGQVFSLEAPDGTDPAWLLERLNAWNERAIVIRDSVEVPEDFDARFSAIRRRYRYQLHGSKTADPFLDRYSWWVRDDLKITRMRAATKDLIGEHDFSSFCRKGRRTAGCARWSSLPRPCRTASG